MKTKTFDAVKFMRDTRDQLSKRYRKNPAQQERDLGRIRAKYKKLKRAAATRRPKGVAFVER